MSVELLRGIAIIFAFTILPLGGVIGAAAGFRRSRTAGKIVWGLVATICSAPIVALEVLLGGLVLVNAPFTGGVIAYSSTPAGDEACVVQSSAIVEYRVSLYARHRGEAWHWNYLCHDDTRWRDCRIDFKGDELQVYRDGALQKTLSIAEATAATEPYYQLPASYTPAQICAKHDGKTL
jgi:hypothetical protein